MRPSGSTEVDRYISGFLAGQAVAYCEMVSRGVRLAGQLDVPAESCPALVELVQREGCKAHVVPRDGRAALWIYRDERIEKLIHALDGTVPMPPCVAVWGMGKLFGYSDRDILDYLAST
jgi:hypothetical protein